MEKREATLKCAFIAELHRQLPGFLVLRYATRGAPDRSIVGAGVTTRWEFKHATPGFVTNGIQELMMLRLAAAGHARYVIWEERRGRQRTMIMHPKHIDDRQSETWCVGFNMCWLVEQVKQAHGL